MSSDDFPGEMDEFPFDDRDADAVFGASPTSAPVPADLRDVADLVHAARGAGSAGELLGADLVVARIAAVVGEPVPSIRVDAHERTRVLKKFRTVKLAAAATATLMLGATAAAAATGTLPSPVQSSVATGLSNVGISLPAHHHVLLAVKHASPAPHLQPHHDGEKRVGKGHGPKHGLVGTVASVNGVSTTGACPTTGAGSFTLTGRKGATFTVNVTTATLFSDQGVTTPSFANVCVGLRACAKGTITGMTLAATKVLILPATPPAPPVPPTQPQEAHGKVASVNGMSTPGACGSGTAGQFTIDAGKSETFTVNVSLPTTYFEKGVTPATFVNVCVGELVFVKGTVTDTSVAATSVFIAPVRHEKEHHHGVFGTVASVNGTSVAGTCGKEAMTGSFTLNGRKGTSVTVSVGTATKFPAFGMTSVSFANVCVGVKVGVAGDASGSTFAATAVFVLPAHSGDDHSGDDDSGHDHSGPGHRAGDDDGDHHDVVGHKAGRGHKGHAGNSAISPSGGSGSEH